MKRFGTAALQFGKRLRELRLRQNLSAEEVARQIEVAPSTYREWENGRSITGFPYLPLTRVLSVSLEELFGAQDGRAQELRTALTEIEQCVNKIRNSL